MQHYDCCMHLLRNCIESAAIEYSYYDRNGLKIDNSLQQLYRNYNKYRPLYADHILRNAPHNYHS